MQFPNQFQNDSFDIEGLMLDLFTWWKMSKERNKEGLRLKFKTFKTRLILIQCYKDIFSQISHFKPLTEHE